MEISERSLIEGLSYALDVAEKSYLSHSKHVGYMSYMIAKELSLSDELLKDVYYASLLHDIGASNTYSIEEHCAKGRDILEDLPLSAEIADYVLYHHEYSNGSGPFGLNGEQIPGPAQIICLANLFDEKFGRLNRLDFTVMKEIRLWLETIRDHISIDICMAFDRVIQKEYVLLDYYGSEFVGCLSNRVTLRDEIVGFEAIRSFSQAFSKIIDRRSSFTYRHSVDIAHLTSVITSKLGYDQEVRNKMYIAALLHDIGKLAIPNSIIDKEGKLDPEERFEINKHTYYTRWILEQIKVFEEINEYASNHHEKINGSGYPLHLAGIQIGELDRIMMICDIYQALTEPRPYRDGMPIDKVWGIIDEMVTRNELDGVLVEKIKNILAENPQ